MQKNAMINMTSGDYRKEILSFTVPILIGNLFQQLYNTADSLIVGNFLGAEALAAVTGVGSLVFLFTGFFMGFSTGAGVVIARAIGARDEERTQRAIHTTAAFSILLSIIMTVLGVFLSPYILHWMGTPEDVFDLSNLYLRIYFEGFGGLVIYNMMTGILQAAGDARHPLIYLVVSSMINIVLDTVFIAVFHMGVDGAAYATILSEILTAILVVRRLMHTQGSVQLHLSCIRLDKQMLSQIMRYGVPTAVQGSVIDISNILIQSYINSFGAAAMAGIGASTKVEGFAFLPVTAFSLAMTTYLSQNMGAKEYERVRKGMHFGFLASLLIIEAIGVTLFVFAPQFIAFFNRSADVIYYGVGRSRVCSLFFFLVGFSHISSAVMRGIGKPMVPTIVMLVCWCLVRVAVLFTIGTVFHDIRLAWWIYPVTWTLSSIVFFLYIRKIERNGFENLEA
ncbi:MAG: MATE family efflux transporter [Bulleidia sp.]|nr:MATE family efflux transporter [Bulleidia sp.]